MLQGMRMRFCEIAGLDDAHALLFLADFGLRSTVLLLMNCLFNTRALSAEVRSILVDLVMLLLVAAKGNITKAFLLLQTRADCLD